MAVHENNNNLLFQSFYKEVWRKLIPPGLTEAEADFIQEIAQLAPGARVLDIMCGYGRHALALARRGFKLTALDNLQDYIDEIKEAARVETLQIDARVEDIASVRLDASYDAIICMGNCFSTFDKARIIKFLPELARSLPAGGVFIINSWMIGEIVIKHFEEKTWLYVDEYKYLLDNQYLLNPTRVETDHILINEDGTVQTLKGVDYVFTFAELQEMLEEAGFQLEEIYSTPRKRKYKFGDNKAYIVARKK